MVKFRLNGKDISADVPGDMPLLWVLRDTLGFTGTKYGCGMALCGACTVHIDGQATRSCVVPVLGVEGRTVTTIEGIGTLEHLHPVQQAWIEEQVPQCGYCQPGMIMAVAAFLKRIPRRTTRPSTAPSPISVAAEPIRASGAPFIAPPNCVAAPLITE